MSVLCDFYRLLVRLHFSIGTIRDIWLYIRNRNVAIPLLEVNMAHNNRSGAAGLAPLYSSTSAERRNDKNVDVKRLQFCVAQKWRHNAVAQSTLREPAHADYCS